MDPDKLAAATDRFLKGTAGEPQRILKVARFIANLEPGWSESEADSLHAHLLQLLLKRNESH